MNTHLLQEDDTDFRNVRRKARARRSAWTIDTEYVRVHSLRTHRENGVSR